MTKQKQVATLRLVIPNVLAAGFYVVVAGVGVNTLLLLLPLALFVGLKIAHVNRTHAAGGAFLSSISLLFFMWAASLPNLDCGWIHGNIFHTSPNCASPNPWIWPCFYALLGVNIFIFLMILLGSRRYQKR